MRQWRGECGEIPIRHTGSIRARSPILAANSSDTTWSFLGETLSPRRSG